MSYPAPARKHPLEAVGRVRQIRQDGAALPQLREDPAHRHYDDQVKFWVDGQYLPLYSYPAPGELRPSQIESQLILEPEG